jgi:hypothetical protein
MLMVEDSPEKLKLKFVTVTGAADFVSSPITLYTTDVVETFLFLLFEDELNCLQIIQSDRLLFSLL